MNESPLQAFGAPWIVVDTGSGKTQAYFGTDKFHYIADLIGKNFPGALRDTPKAREIDELKAKL